MQVILHLGGGRGEVGMQGTLALHLGGGGGGGRGDASASCEKRKTNASILISFVSFVQIIFYPIKFQIQKGQHFNLLFFVGQQLQKYWIPPAGRSWVEPNFNNSNRLAGGQPASPQIYLALAFGGGGEGVGMQGTLALHLGGGEGATQMQVNLHFSFK